MSALIATTRLTVDTVDVDLYQENQFLGVATYFENGTSCYPESIAAETAELIEDLISDGWLDGTANGIDFKIL